MVVNLRPKERQFLPRPGNAYFLKRFQPAGKYIKSLINRADSAIICIIYYSSSYNVWYKLHGNNYTILMDLDIL
jgi:hypothetical protein